ncbi:MAG: sulfotransferase family protein [Acidimicrobiia bacterium]
MRLRSLTARVRREVGQRRPTPCPEGWSTGPPSFVGVGTQRSGTTWWHHLVTSHPGVHDGPAKELRFFDRYWRHEFAEDDVARYHRFFPRPPGRQVGEWSPGYVSHFWIPALLRRAAPDAKLLVSLRDPVERYRSGVALQSETRRASQATASAAFRLGCYATHLEQLYASCPREQVLVQQFERCVADPEGELARTYAFLGLDDTFVPADLRTPRNQSRSTKATLPEHERMSIVSAYRPEVDRLLELVPGFDRALWSNFAG